MTDTLDAGSPPTAPHSRECDTLSDQRAILQFIARGGFDDLVAVCLRFVR